MSTLLEDIKAQIVALKTDVAQSNVVREIGDGVAKIEGLTDAMLNEMLDFGNGVTGLALEPRRNRSRRDHLGDFTEDQGRRRSPHHRQAAAGAGRQGLLGRVVDALGKPIDGKGPIKPSKLSRRKKAPGIIPRKSVSQPMRPASRPSTR
jgi:F-type H+-transporting ATPase subunit alpha